MKINLSRRSSNSSTLSHVRVSAYCCRGCGCPCLPLSGGRLCCPALRPEMNSHPSAGPPLDWGCRGSGPLRLQSSSRRSRQSTGRSSLPSRPVQQWVSGGLGGRRNWATPLGIRWSLMVCGSSVPSLPSPLGCVCERRSRHRDLNCLSQFRLGYHQLP